MARPHSLEGARREGRAEAVALITLQRCLPLTTADALADAVDVKRDDVLAAVRRIAGHQRAARLAEQGGRSSSPAAKPRVPCPICGLEFIGKGGMSRHRTVSHRNEIPRSLTARR